MFWSGILAPLASEHSACAHGRALGSRGVAGKGGWSCMAWDRTAYRRQGPGSLVAAQASSPCGVVSRSRALPALAWQRAPHQPATLGSASVPREAAALLKLSGGVRPRPRLHRRQWSRPLRPARCCSARLRRMHGGRRAMGRGCESAHRSKRGLGRGFSPLPAMPASADGGRSRGVVRGHRLAGTCSREREVRPILHAKVE